MDIKVGRVYRHFKGNLYIVEGIAVNSENLKKMVIVHYNDKESSKIAINKLKEDMNIPFIVYFY